MRLYKWSLLLLLPLAFLSLLPSCGKKAIGKAYHNITGRYNGYYNADMIWDQTIQQLNAQHAENYNQLLPIYPYIQAGDPKSIKASLTKAIEKSTKIILLHEPSHWDDDAYFLIGQSEFLSQEYEKAVNTFQYVVTEFNPEKPLSLMSREERNAEKIKRATGQSSSSKVSTSKSRKQLAREKEKEIKRLKRLREKNARLRRQGKLPNKSQQKEEHQKEKEEEEENEEEEEEKPEKYGLKHRPVRYRSMLWLARTYIQMGEHNEAAYFLRKLENSNKVPIRLHPEVQVAKAHSFILRERYSEAIEPLEMALGLFKRKKQKTRYAYILAQLYQMQGNEAKAMEYFESVIRLRPTYEMEFNARLRMIENAAKSGSQDIDPEKALRKMARDEKNREYRDQIYFALAKIQLNANQVDKGIASLQKSLNLNQGNVAQRAEAYLMLADLYFQKEDFVPASSYYDSTLTAMNKEDKRYGKVEMQSLRLKDLAANLRTIELQDSLLMVASLDPDAQKKLVQRLRKEQMLAKEKEANANSRQRNVANMSGVAARGGNLVQNKLLNSEFALYNPSLVKKGEREFTRRWGNRAWQDNWRTSSGGSQEEEAASVQKSKKALPPMTQKEVEDFMQKNKVPLSASAKEQSNKSIETALFQSGLLFDAKLDDLPRAAKQLERLLERYPDTEHRKEALYRLQQFYQKMGNGAKAASFEKLLLAEYPNSDLAKALKDPNFMDEAQAEIKRLNKVYDEAFQLVKNGQAATARAKVEQVTSSLKKDHPLSPRFSLLQALCIGGTEGKEAYIRALNIVVTSYPETPEKAKAEEMLRYLSGSSAPVAQKPKDVPSDAEVLGPNSPFHKDMDGGHYVLVVFDNKNTRLNPEKVNVSNYNNQFHKLERLRVSNLLLDLDIPTLIIRKFRDAQQAMKYYYEVISAGEEFLKAPHQAYVISQKNYKVVLQKRNFTDYIPFFRALYLK